MSCVRKRNRITAQYRCWMVQKISDDSKTTEENWGTLLEERMTANRQATRVVDRLFELSGGRALYLQHPLQRIWRDVHAASQHLGLQFEFAMESYGRTLVGLPSGSLM